MKQNILEWEHVSGNTGKFDLSDISFSLPAGSIMGIAGKNGAGKTTLIDYMVNPKRRYTGVIRLGGIDIRNDHPAMLREIGLVSEENRFLLERSARQNAEILGILYENWDMECFLLAMESMELAPTKVVGKMSRGENMKFQMAFAMAHKSRLYLLDEVTAGMDPVFRIDFFKILQKVIEGEEASVLMTSHLQEEIERKMDYVGIMENGKMTAFGEADTVAEGYGDQDETKRERSDKGRA